MNDFIIALHYFWACACDDKVTVGHKVSSLHFWGSEVPKPNVKSCSNWFQCFYKDNAGALLNVLNDFVFRPQNHSKSFWMHTCLLHHSAVIIICQEDVILHTFLEGIRHLLIIFCSANFFLWWRTKCDTLLYGHPSEKCFNCKSESEIGNKRTACLLSFLHRHFCKFELPDVPSSDFRPFSYICGGVTWIAFPVLRKWNLNVKLHCYYWI